MRKTRLMSSATFTDVGAGALGIRVAPSGSGGHLIISQDDSTIVVPRALVVHFIKAIIDQMPDNQFGQAPESKSGP